MRRLAGNVLYALALALACGDTPASSTGTGSAGETSSSGETSSTGGTSSTGTPTSGGTSSGETTTSGAPPDTGGGESSGASEATSTGASASETGDDGTASGTTGAPATPVTRAWWVDGNTLQIRVIQQDDGAGLCRGVFLEALANGGTDSPEYEPVEQPADWGVRFVFVHDAPADCFDPYTWYEHEPAFAGSATGTVTFHAVDDDGKPASLDVDVTGAYRPGEPWVPGQDRLLAAGVAVEVG